MNFPPVMISRQTDLPPDITTELEEQLKAMGIEYSLEEKPPRSYAGLEHFLPTALLILLAKPFFDAFLSEAGKDSYALFKRALVALLLRAKKLRIDILYSGELKMDPNYAASRIVSIYSFSGVGQRVRFSFPASAEEDEYLLMIDKMLQLLVNSHLHPHPDELSEALARANRMSLQVMVFSHERQAWELLKSR